MKIKQSFSTKNIFEITKKELKYFFDQPTGYLLLTVFTGLLYYFFLKTFFIDRFVSLRQMFQWLPWFLTILVPAVTMSSFAKENENQTLEYILTKPLKKVELILGKILGSTFFIYIGILLTLPLVIFLPRLGQLDFGETFASYLGAFIFVLIASAIGTAISSFFKKQITSFIFGAVILFIFNIISTDLVTINLSTGVAAFLSSLSLIDHFRSITRGVLLLEDLGYFLSLFIASYLIAFWNISKYQESRTLTFVKKNMLYLIWMLIVIVVIFSISKTSLGRFDLTSTKKYSLSETTKKLIQSDGKIMVEVYASPEMPQEFQYKRTELKNMLEDYKRNSHQNFSYSFIDPKDKETELTELGINPVEFRVYGQDEIKAKQGYFGLLVKNEAGDKKEVIPTVDRIDNLEYEVTKLVKKIKNTEKPKIAFATGNGERSIFEEYQYLEQLIEPDYEIKTETFPIDTTGTKTQPIYPDLKQYKLVVIANPVTNYTKASKQKILDYIKTGGNLIYLVDPIDVNTQIGQAIMPDEKNPRGDLLKDLGVTVNKNLAYDLEKFGYINLTGINNQVLRTPYPLFMFAEKTALSADLFDNVLFGWSGTVSVQNQDWQPLFTTSTKGGTINENISVDPNGNFSQDNLEKQVLAVYKDKDNSKQAVFATARIFDNEFMSIEQNAALSLKLFEKFTDTTGLSEIKAKNITGDQFFVTTELNKNLIRVVSPALSTLILLVIGYSRFRRQKAIRKKYFAV